MVRIGLVVVFLALLGIVVLGIGMGTGLLQVDSHGLALVHKDDANSSSDATQGRVVSADDLLRQKGVTYTEPAATEAPKPAETEVAKVTPPPAPTPAPVPVVVKAPVTPAVAPSVAPVVAQKPVNPPVIPVVAPQPIEASSRQPGRREGDRVERGVIRIAAGSKAPLTDGAGNVWEAASGFEGGEIKSEVEIPIENTRFAKLYTSHYWNPTAWRRTIPNGDYTIVLHFAETSPVIHAGGVRLFDMDVQDQHLSGIDVMKESGGFGRAFTRTVTTAVKNESLVMHFAKVGEHFPFICGIEVIPGARRADPRAEPRRGDQRDDGRRTPAVRVNAGSQNPARDARGNIWEADSGFDGGEIVDRGAIAIANTDFPDIYRTEHFNMTGWHKAMPNGDYIVNLHFAETCDHINDAHPRIFNIVVQKTELHDFNVVKEAGGPCKALIKTFHVTVADGNLAIVFQKGGNDAPEINGIEVIAERPTIRINAGSPTAVRDPKGNAWEAESGFDGGKIIDRGPIAIANTDFPDIYRTEHYDMTGWSRWVPNGKYTVNLHFAETWDGINDSHQRIFHVVVQGVELRDLNPMKETGGLRRALVKTFHVEVTDGRLAIVFQQVGDNVPEINGIEVIPER